MMPPGPARAFRTAVRFICRVYLVWVHRIRYKGLEHVPAQGPVVLAGNHQSYLDPVPMGAALERVVFYMAWKKIWRVPGLGPLIDALGAFPVDIEGAHRHTIERALDVLRGGRILGIYPEAGRGDEGGRLVATKNGAARLAVSTGALMVPAIITGAYRVWPKRRRLPRPGRITVCYRPPLPRPDPAWPEERQVEHYMTALRATLERRINASLRAEARMARLYAARAPGLRLGEILGPAAVALHFAAVGGDPDQTLGWCAAWQLAALAWVGLDIACSPRGRFWRIARNAASGLALALGGPAGTAGWPDALWSIPLLLGLAQNGHRHHPAYRRWLLGGTALCLLLPILLGLAGVSAPAALLPLVWLAAMQIPRRERSAILAAASIAALAALAALELAR